MPSPSYEASMRDETNSIEEWYVVQSANRVGLALDRAEKATGIEHSEYMTTEDEAELDAEFKRQLGLMATTDLLEGLVKLGEVTKTIGPDGLYIYALAEQ